jgi:voltage-gated potassium channel Kch
MAYESTRAPLRERLRYRFDNSMARGPSALIGYLAIATAILAVIFALIVLLASLGPTRNAVTAVYNALLHVIDAGTVTADDTSSATFIILQLLLTLGGIVIFSAFIGVLATTFDQWLSELRKGRSNVLEADHTLVLGWSDTIFTVLSELAIANENERDPSVVVLADRDKVEMEDAIRAKVPDLRGTRVVCRTGSTIDLRDLAIVSPDEARSIIVLSPDEEEPDASVIKTILALTRGPGRREEPYHIVAEIEAAENLEAARLVGGDEAVLVDKSETVARIIVQTARQSGAAAVYTELLDFDGDEVYFRRDPAWENRTYAEALLAYEDCCVMGFKEGDRVRLNPPPDTVLPGGCELIAIAADDANLEAATAATATVDEAAIVTGEPDAPRAQHTLLIGFNGRTPTVIRELDEYVEAGSTVTLVADREVARERLLADTGRLEHLIVDVRRGSTTARAALEALDLGRFDNVIVMCYADDLDAQRADARTLITLLHLRDIVDRTGVRIPIVSEMLDDRNRELAQVTKVDDVIVSDQVISLLLSQISENPHLAAVFAELFDAAGSEVYLRDASAYVTAGAEVSFATLIASAARRGETAIGYRSARLADDAAANYGVTVNPPKSMTFRAAPKDRLIVLAEE